uniref:RRM domain-containing protein n=1 Tax=Plectus sambesii TaxID=2011161 RepID=A0A914VXZ2_9BILA
MMMVVMMTGRVSSYGLHGRVCAAFAVKHTLVRIRRARRERERERERQGNRAVAALRLNAWVRTLFVSGLPMDAKPRELYLLFRSYPGYESSLLKVTNKNGKTSSPVGFVTFTTKSTADEAKKDLQGVKFDPDLPQTIRLEFAKSNTKVSKPKQQSPPAAAMPTFLHPAFTGQEMLSPFMHTAGSAEQLLQANALAFAELTSPAAAAAAQTTAFTAGGAMHPLFAQAFPGGVNAFQYGALQNQIALGQLATSTAGHHQALFSAAATGYPAIIPTSMAAMSALSPAVSAMSAMSAASGACSTLFVANLGASVNEDELREVFRSFPGFCRLRMHNKNGSPVAFVEYQDLRQATQAINSLQGFVLVSSDRGGMRIEYARNKMGDVSFVDCRAPNSVVSSG